MSVGSVGSGSSNAGASASSAGKARETSSGNTGNVNSGSGTGAVAGSGTDKTADVKTETGSTKTDQVSIDDKAVADNSGVSSDLMSGLQDAYGVDKAKEAAETGAAGEAEAAETENPYSDLADYSVTMKPEAWTSDRTPAEGQVARNDHLEGMLRNQGFELSDIYAKGEDGKTMLERVAAENNLRDPNLITPEQELVLPSRHEPPITDPEVKVDELNGKTVEQNVSASGDGARAEASVEAGKITDSDISQTVTAEGNEAEASAKVKAGEISGSQIEQNVTAVGNEAEAKAEVKAEVVSDSDISQDVRAEGNEAEANSSVDIGKTEGEVNIDRTSVANGTGAEVNSETVVGENAGDLTIVDKAVANGDGASVAQGALVGDNQGSATVDLDAQVSGEGTGVRQDVIVGGEGPAEVAVSATGDGSGTSEQYVEGPGHGSATVVADGVAHPSQDVSGFENVKQVQINSEGAILGTDAKNAEYVGEADNFVTIHHQGTDGSVRLDAKSDESVVVLDGVAPGSNGALLVPDSGNAITGNVEAKDVRIVAGGAESVNIGTTGTDGDDRHEVIGPDGTTVVSNLGGGKDSSVVNVDGESATYVQKTDGEIGLYGQRNGASQIAVDAGQAAITGNLNLSGADDQVYLQAESGGHSLRTTGGDGNDVLVLDLKGDAPVPRIVTDEGYLGGLFGGDSRTPEGWSEADGSITALDYESIVIRRDGEVIDSIGEVPANLAAFQDAAAEIQARLQAAQ